MANKRDVLAQLSRAELLNFVSETGVEVADRRVREKLVEALAGSRAAKLSGFLGSLSRDRLKELAGALGLETGGRDKAVFVERLAGGAPAKAAAKVSAKGAAKAKSANGGRAAGAATRRKQS